MRIIGGRQHRREAPVRGSTHLQYSDASLLSPRRLGTMRRMSSLLGGLGEGSDRCRWCSQAFAPGLTWVADLAPPGGHQVRPGVELVAGNPPIAKCLPVAADYRRSVCKSAGNRVWEVVTYDRCRKLALFDHSRRCTSSAAKEDKPDAADEAPRQPGLTRFGTRNRDAANARAPCARSSDILVSSSWMRGSSEAAGVHCACWWCDRVPHGCACTAADGKGASDRFS